MSGTPQCRQPVRLGFGASGAWALPLYAEKEAAAVIKQALELGIRDFDTAGFYAGGRAETRLGSSLRQFMRSDIGRNLSISTKIGKAINDRGRIVRDFRPRTILSSLERSCDRLGVETLNIVYMHGPDEHELYSSLPHLLALKKNGAISAIGICSDGVALAHAATLPEIDVVMGRYNILDQRNGPALASAKQHGKQVVAIAPLAQALWRRNLILPRSIPDFWYSARALVRNRKEWINARQAEWLHKVEGWSAAQLAIAFVADAPFTDVIMTTTTRPTHLQESAAALLRTLPPEVRERAQGCM